MTMTDKQISVLDDDQGIRDFLYTLLSGAGFTVRTYRSARHFLADCIPPEGCLIAEIRMPEIGGIDLLKEMKLRSMSLPVIFVAGHADVPLAVRAMKAGAADFIEKPIDAETIVASVGEALAAGLRAQRQAVVSKVGRDAIALLTPRERHVLDQIAKGRSNKITAHELGISIRTVEFHRARIMEKLKAHHMSDLLRVAFAVEQAMNENTPPAARLAAAGRA